MSIRPTTTSYDPQIGTAARVRTDIASWIALLQTAFATPEIQSRLNIEVSAYFEIAFSWPRCGTNWSRRDNYDRPANPLNFYPYLIRQLCLPLPRIESLLSCRHFGRSWQGAAIHLEQILTTASHRIAADCAICATISAGDPSQTFINMTLSLVMSRQTGRQPWTP